jgi:hypothetical protein
VSSAVEAASSGSWSSIPHGGIVRVADTLKRELQQGGIYRAHGAVFENTFWRKFD